MAALSIELKESYIFIYLEKALLSVISVLNNNSENARGYFFKTLLWDPEFYDLGYNGKLERLGFFKIG